MTWLVLGAGTSGLGAASLLRAKNLRVVISDNTQLSDEKRELLSRLSIPLKEGGTDLSHLDGIDEGLILSPGIPPSHPYCIEARRRGLPILSEVDLALNFYAGHVLGVTGTNGKSTTTAMLGYLLNQAGVPASVAGNIGITPSQLIADQTISEHLVLELSSYQLELSEKIAPRVAILTSFTPDHLARHKNLQDYLRAKWRIFSQQSPADLAIIAEEAWNAAQKYNLPRPCSKTHILNQHFAETIFPEATPETEFEHNRLNACAAVVACAAITGHSWDKTAALLRGFKGLPYRCEKIGTWGGRAVINDSKATNVDSTLVALASQKSKVILMLGGQSKGERFTPILRYKDKIAKVITFGATREDIKKDLTFDEMDGVPFAIASFPQLSFALRGLPPEVENFAGDILFSPACPSYDEFKNFEERGYFFSQNMLPLLDGKA